MHTTTKIAISSAICSLAAVLLPHASFAASQASIKIEQMSPKSYGTWTFLKPNGDTVKSTDTGVNKLNYALGVTEFGPMTLSVTSPAGMSVKVLVYRGNELLRTETVPQISFQLFPNDNYRFVIQYSYNRLGNLGVTSDPSGVRFRLKGPVRRTLTSVSPKTFVNIPAGKYTIYFSSTKNCSNPAPYTVDVQPEQRNTAFVTLTCNSVKEDLVDTSRPTKRSLVEAARLRETRPRGERK